LCELSASGLGGGLHLTEPLPDRQTMTESKGFDRCLLLRQRRAISLFFGGDANVSEESFRHDVGLATRLIVRRSARLLMRMVARHADKRCDQALDFSERFLAFLPRMTGGKSHEEDGAGIAVADDSNFTAPRRFARIWEGNSEKICVGHQTIVRLRWTSGEVSNVTETSDTCPPQGCLDSLVV
jgi:hypothetical protein